MSHYSNYLLWFSARWSQSSMTVSKWNFFRWLNFCSPTGIGPSTHIALHLTQIPGCHNSVGARHNPPTSQQNPNIWQLTRISLAVYHPSTVLAFMMLNYGVQVGTCVLNIRMTLPGITGLLYKNLCNACWHLEIILRQPLSCTQQSVLVHSRCLEKPFTATFRSCWWRKWPPSCTTTSWSGRKRFPCSRSGSLTASTSPPTSTAALICPCTRWPSNRYLQATYCNSCVGFLTGHNCSS